MTGPLAALGEQEYNGMQMAVSKVNSDGGIKGKRLELVTEDYASDSKKVISAYEALKQRGIEFIFVDGGNGIVPVAPLLRKNGDFGMVPIGIHGTYFDGNPKTCRIALTAKDFSRSIGGYAMEKFPNARVAFLVTANEYGNTARTSIEDFVEEHGGTIVATESYDQTASDFRTQVTKLKALQDKTDALVIINATNSIEAMLKQLKQLGYMKQIVADLFTIVNPAMKDLALANGVVFVDYPFVAEPQSDDSPILAEFKRSFFKKYGGYPLAAAVNGYDSVMVVAQAMQNAGDITPAAVSDYMTTRMGPYEAVGGTLKFNSDCEVSRPSVMHVIEDGKVKVAR